MRARREETWKNERKLEQVPYVGEPQKVAEAALSVAKHETSAIAATRTE